MPPLTIIIPAFNDATGLNESLPKLIALAKKNSWEIILVNDCSSDNTTQILQKFTGMIKVIENAVNMGYGASLKRGILAAKTQWVATIDADGQHCTKDLEQMALEITEELDAIVGTRNSQSHTPTLRKPGKWVLAKVANFITGQKIPDINCGLRILRKDIMIHLLSVTSDRFSFTTSTLICLLQNGCAIKFIPVTTTPRIGSSTVNQVRDGMYTLMLILRLIILFKPLRVFLPISLVLLFLAGANQIYIFIRWGMDITTASVLLGLGGLIVFFMSLIADQISGFRRTYLFHEIKMRQLYSPPPES